MKKGILFLTLLIMTTVGTFAVGVSLDFRLSYLGADTSEHMEIINELREGGLGLPNTIPGIGIAVCWGGPVELLLEFDLWLVGAWGNIFGIDLESGLGRINISTGAAPRVAATERLTLTFPIMLTFSYSEFYFDIGDETTEISFITFGTNIGARAIYSLNQRWSLFAGIKTTVLSFNSFPTVEGKIEGIPISGRFDFVSFNLFSTGRIDLGVRFHF